MDENQIINQNGKRMTDPLVRQCTYNHNEALVTATRSPTANHGRKAMFQLLGQPGTFARSLILEPCMRRIALGAALAALCLGAFAGSAAAAPQKGVWDMAFTDDPVDIGCPFTVYATFHQTGQFINFFDNSGAPTQTQVHATEQLTLSANGRTLKADPIEINVLVDYGPNGELEHVYLAGVVLRVPLPDGTTFLSAGRVDLVPRGGFAVTPDVGRSGDVGALCTALS